MYNRSNRGGHSSFRGRPSYGHSRGGFKQKSFRDVSKFINKATITEEVEVFKPEHSFADFNIDEKLKQNIARKGYVLPTPIQDKTIPHIVLGADVVGLAATGTGKTAAFLIPLINKVMKAPRENVLIVVPTRELATQIQDELRSFTQILPIFSISCVGGAPINPQIRALSKRNQFVIGTPGRLKDLIERKVLNLGDFRTVVLDEADRMLDMGFINDIKYMMSLMSPQRQTLFFSATLSKEIEALISQFLNNPVKISVRTRDTSKSVDQDVVRAVPGEHKLETLKKLLKEEGFSKVLIFGKTKHGVERLSLDLAKHGFKAESIHGNKNQRHRELILGKFKKNVSNILVATDVAARGLDIPDVTHVINYDLPSTYEDYIHRIGRTGRAGKKGKALTFIE